MNAATSYGKEEIVTKEVFYALKKRLLNVSANLDTKWPQVYHLQFNYQVVLRLRFGLPIKTKLKR